MVSANLVVIYNPDKKRAKLDCVCEKGEDTLIGLENCINVVYEVLGGTVDKADIEWDLISNYARAHTQLVSEGYLVDKRLKDMQFILERRPGVLLNQVQEES